MDELAAHWRSICRRPRRGDILPVQSAAAALSPLLVNVSFSTAMLIALASLGNLPGSVVTG